ncbi:MAG TPA: protein kinase [Thermoanaerobaculia bacterium]|nr:protein kinase [Thermoanaerobaculia bacterium]
MSDLPSPPVSLGHYQIVRPLGAGGMGEVYLATDTRLNRDVAIKILPPSSTLDRELQRRMLREARLIANIDHPNVCTIYEIGEEESRPYIVMQYVEGETLGQRLRRGRMSLGEAIDFGRQVTAALAQAHKRGIVHRDIKPGNIMISSSGVVKVLDFGLAKSFLRGPDDATEMVVSTPNFVAGTAPYMSPEQLLGEALDGRSDLFSLGTVLYEIATGKRPFDRRTAAATINAILMDDPEPFGENDLVELESLTFRALTKPLARRFADASAMHEALTSLAEGRSSPVRVATATTTVLRRQQSTMPPDPAAEKLYLRGRAQWNKRHPEALRQAISLFQEAVEMDPMHANSFAGLADVYMMLGFLQVIRPRDIIPKAKASAMRAIELAPELAEPHASLGYVAAMFEWDWATAQSELLEAMRLNPGYAWAPHWYGILAGPLLPEESQRNIARAYALDPLSPIIHTGIGVGHYMRGEYEAALRLFTEVLDTGAAFAPAYYYAGLSFEQMGNYESAVTSLFRGAEIGGRGGLYLAALGHCYGVSGQRELAQKVLDELEERSRERYVSPFDLMLLHLGVGEHDLAFESLKLALEDRIGGLWFLRVERRFDPIRDDRRVKELLVIHGLQGGSD